MIFDDLRGNVDLFVCETEQTELKSHWVSLLPLSWVNQTTSAMTTQGRCRPSQPENGPCPFLPCSISSLSHLSFVRNTACNKKSQRIYEVWLAGTQVFYLPGRKQLCYNLQRRGAASRSFPASPAYICYKTTRRSPSCTEAQPCFRL